MQSYLAQKWRAAVAIEGNLLAVQAAKAFQTLALSLRGLEVIVVDNYYGLKFKVIFWVPWQAIYRASSYLASEVVLIKFTKLKRHGYNYKSKDKIFIYLSTSYYQEMTRQY